MLRKLINKETESTHRVPLTLDGGRLRLRRGVPTLKRKEVVDKLTAVARVVLRAAARRLNRLLAVALVSVEQGAILHSPCQLSVLVTRDISASIGTHAVPDT